MRSLYLGHFLCILTLAFAGCGIQSPRATVYQKDFPFPDNEQNIGARSYAFAPVDKGYIVTMKNDTVFGLVKLIYYPYGDHIPVLPINMHNASNVVNIKRNDIKYIRTYSDSMQNNFIDYVNIGVDGLWRRLGAKNEVGLFDNYDNMGNGQKYSEKRMLLVIEDRKLLMYDSFQSLFHNRYSYLLRFINKRYRENLSKKDFQDEQAEINYILIKENETIKR